MKPYEGHAYTTCKCHPHGYCTRCGYAPSMHDESKRRATA